MTEVESITREIAALDAEFNSPENCRTGKMKLHEYSTRHTALRARLAEAELAARTRPAPRPRPRTGDDAPVTVGFLSEVLSNIAPRVGKEIREHVARALDPVHARLLQLADTETRIRELETAVPQYRGVHRAGTRYTKNSIVTLGGSMWIALKDTTAKPPHDDWRCCVQRGR